MKCALCRKIKKCPHYLFDKERRTESNKIHRICHLCYKKQHHNRAKRKEEQRRYRAKYPIKEDVRRQAVYHTLRGKLWFIYRAISRNALKCHRRWCDLFGNGCNKKEHQIPLMTWDKFKAWAMKGDYPSFFHRWQKSGFKDTFNFGVNIDSFDEGYDYVTGECRDEETGRKTGETYTDCYMTWQWLDIPPIVEEHQEDYEKAKAEGNQIMMRILKKEIEYLVGGK